MPFVHLFVEFQIGSCDRYKDKIILNYRNTNSVKNHKFNESLFSIYNIVEIYKRLTSMIVVIIKIFEGKFEGVLIFAALVLNNIEFVRDSCITSSLF